MRLQLNKSGYQLNAKTNVWSRADYNGIAYSDGDEIENRIADIIDKSSDITVLSNELRQHCTDWPSLYHLSGTRANILRPFQDILKGADVLEIGAGCGAITRYLGECGANVLALEGSPRRASIARSRTRDLTNVTLVAERFDQFQWERKFDLITLIGVLEYSNLFMPRENPALAMLQHVRALLKPSGKLIIAIENQLGLKYFAGAPEDHLGQPMYGIEGRYRENQPQTYGRKVLTGMLWQAGFTKLELLAPFPDYKLPISIITEGGLSCNGFDAGSLACQSVRRDPQLPPILAFSPELVWSSLVQNGIVLDLTNSFLVVAGTSAMRNLDSSILAYHFSTDRSREFCKETRFFCTDAGSIEVQYHSLAPSGSMQVEDELLRFFIPHKGEYVNGKPLSQELIDIVTRNNWRIEEVGAFFKGYLYFISSLDSSQQVPLQIDSPDKPLPGDFFDFIPHNIIICPDGSWQIIDKEWILKKNISVGFIIFRSLLSLVCNVTRFFSTVNESFSTVIDFFHAAFKATGLIVSNDQIESYAKLEMAVQANIHKRQLDNGAFLDWLFTAPFPSQHFIQSVNEQYFQIVSLNQIVADREKEIANLISSKSWRLTKPLRFMVRIIKGQF